MSSNDLFWRLAEERHIPALLDIGEMFVGEAGVPATFDPVKAENQLKHVITRMYQHKDMFLAIVPSGEEIAGVCIAHAASEFIQEVWVYLHIFYVRPEFRGLGVGDCLIQSLIEFQENSEAVALFSTSGANISTDNDELFARVFGRNGFTKLGHVLYRGTNNE